MTKSSLLDNIIQPIFLDSSCFIYVFEKNPTYHDLARPIFSLLSFNKLKAYSSLITVTEVLTLPFKRNDNNLIDFYLEMFSQIPNFTVLSPSYDTAIKAAEFRAKYNLNLPDAYQLALAKESNCKSFLTNDGGLKKFKEVKVLCFDDYS